MEPPWAISFGFNASKMTESGSAPALFSLTVTMEACAGRHGGGGGGEGPVCISHAHLQRIGPKVTPQREETRRHQSHAMGCHDHEGSTNLGGLHQTHCLSHVLLRDLGEEVKPGQGLLQVTTPHHNTM
jgi:hypothetical protein